jgi:hypothetical protein
MTRIAPLVALAAVLFSTSAPAATVTITFAGTIGSDGVGSFPPNTPFASTISYDTTTPPESGATTSFAKFAVGGSFTVYIGAQNYTYSIMYAAVQQVTGSNTIQFMATDVNTNLTMSNLRSATAKRLPTAGDYRQATSGFHILSPDHLSHGTGTPLFKVN